MPEALPHSVESGVSAQLPALGQFGAGRARLLAQLAQAEAVAEERGNAPALAELQRLHQNLEAERFHLAVLGQFKRGKTTLLNSLLGEELLPVGVLPLTSILTVLAWGEKPAMVVHFLSGESRELPLADLPLYVTERENPGNARGVRQVEVHHPSPYLRGGLLLVDTPGVGSTLEHNTALTCSFLSRVDAAIFVLSVDPPLTQAEADFLLRAARDVHRFFFVLNKTDLIGAAELAEALQFTRAQLAKQAGLDGAELYALSARNALQAGRAGDSEALEASGMPRFERDLRRFLMEEKGKVLLESVAARLRRLAGELLFEIELEQKAAAGTLQELEEKQQVLAAELGRIEQARADMNVLLASDVARLLARVEEDLRSHVEAELPGALRRLEELLVQHPAAGKAELTRLLDAFLAAEVEEIFTRWRAAEDRRLGEDFHQLSGRFGQSANTIVRRVQEAAARLFAIEVIALDAPESLRAGTGFDFKVEPLFYFPMEKVGFALPRFLFRHHLRRRARRALQQELDRNAGRLRFHYLERLERTSQDFRSDLNQRIDAALAGVRGALERAAEALAATGAARQANQARLLRQLEALAALRPGEAPQPGDVDG